MKETQASLALMRRHVPSHLLLIIYPFISVLPGTFGQSSPWDIFTPASWSRSGVPCEVLTNPQSLPAHPALERGVPATLTGETEQEKAVEGKAGAEVGPGTSRSPGLYFIASRQISMDYKAQPGRVKA